MVNSRIRFSSQTLGCSKENPDIFRDLGLCEIGADLAQTMSIDGTFMSESAKAFFRTDASLAVEKKGVRLTLARKKKGSG